MQDLTGIQGLLNRLAKGETLIKTELDPSVGLIALLFATASIVAVSGVLSALIINQKKK